MYYGDPKPSVFLSQNSHVLFTCPSKIIRYYLFKKTNFFHRGNEITYLSNIECFHNSVLETSQDSIAEKLSCKEALSNSIDCTNSTGIIDFGI